MLRETRTGGNTAALLLLLLTMALSGCSEVIIDPVALAESENATNSGDDGEATSEIDSDTSTDTESETDTGADNSNAADTGGVTTDNATDETTPDDGSTNGETNGETTTDSEVDTANNTGMDDDTSTETNDEPVIGTDTGAGTDSSIGISASPITVGLANCPALSASTSASNISGIYDLTALSESGDDVVYLEIADDGTLIYYDYQQDAFDEADNCYFIDRGLTAYSSIGGDEYIATSYSNYADVNCDTTVQTITVVRSDTQLSTTSVDIDDEDQDGDTTDLVTEVVPKLTGLTADSFNRCE